MTLAKCQRTGVEIPFLEGAFVSSAKDGKRVWEFTCVEAEGTGSDISIPVKALFESPKAYEKWMNHMSQKTWFDKEQFSQFCAKFEHEIGASGLTKA